MESLPQLTESAKLNDKLLSNTQFLSLPENLRRIAFGIARNGDPVLDKNQVLKERFLKVLNSDISISENLGTPLNIFIARLAVPDIVRTVLMGVLVGTNQKYREYFVPFVTDSTPTNRAKNIEILLDFAEAVMVGNPQVDNYLVYLKDNPSPQTFSEWQKSQSSAPVASPQSTILTPTQPTASQQRLANLKQLGHEQSNGTKRPNWLIPTAISLGLLGLGVTANHFLNPASNSPTPQQTNPPTEQLKPKTKLQNLKRDQNQKNVPSNIN